MQPSRSPSNFVRFAAFEVDLETAELRKRGRKVPLQDQSFKLLALLLQRPGDLVTREEYDVQVQVLARTREKLAALEARLAELEKGRAASE